MARMNLYIENLSNLYPYFMITVWHSLCYDAFRFQVVFLGMVFLRSLNTQPNILQEISLQTCFWDDTMK